MSKLAIGLMALVIVLASVPTEAKSPPSPSFTCQLPGSEALTYLALDPLPVPVKQLVARLLGDETGQVIDMVPRDANYQQTDLIELSGGPLSFHRLIQAGRSGSRWYIWFETGGPLSYSLVIGEWRAGDRQARLVTVLDASSGEELCSQTLMHLNDSPAEAGMGG